MLSIQFRLAGSDLRASLIPGLACEVSGVEKSVRLYQPVSMPGHPRIIFQSPTLLIKINVEVFGFMFKILAT